MKSGRRQVRPHLPCLLGGAICSSPQGAEDLDLGVQSLGNEEKFRGDGI